VDLFVPDNHQRRCVLGQRDSDPVHKTMTRGLFLQCSALAGSWLIDYSASYSRGSDD
jgi:hypothetical protein